jgi:hypothetical protein
VLDTLVDLQDQINVLTGIDGTLGTMAQQDANAVAITGGAINNTPIGGTTPAAGTFTTLTATSTATLGGDATNPALVAVASAGNTRWLAVTGSASGNVNLSIGGTGNGNLALIPRGTGGVSLNSGASATNTQFFAAHTASAVNFVQVTGAATGGNVAISSQGSDNSVPILYQAKGGGSHRFITNNTIEHFRVAHATNAVNYVQVTGSAAGNALPITAQGADTNISQVFQSKGTGAINLAPGSSGVNISNGGTVTAVTNTAGGTLYTSLPTPSISAPTTAGGVQATISITMSHLSASTISNGGTGYTVGDVLTIVGGTTGTAAQFTVTSASGGVVTGIARTGVSTYTVLPSSPSATTGGTGTGCTIAVNWSVNTLTITNAGSGYVEQPTVTFSGGGGSGAAAYATVGSGTTVRSLGTNLSVFTPGGEGFRVNDIGGNAVNYWQATNAITGSGPTLLATGGDSAVTANIAARGASNLTFRTNTTTTQLNVSHTASAVNFVQVTGAATGGFSSISAQGSDANAGLLISSKGSASIQIRTNNNSQTQLQVLHTASAVNFFQMTGAAAGASPTIFAAGTDTNIDLALTPKGTGLVRFGAYTATVSTIAGYIEIRDAGGTIRRLAVVA